MPLYPDDFLMELLFSPTTPEVQQISSAWFLTLVQQCYLNAAWPCVAAACGIIVIKLVARVARNYGKSKSKMKNNYSYFKFFETAKMFYKQTTFKFPFSSWFSKSSQLNHQLTRKTPTAKAQPRVTIRTVKGKQYKTKKEGLVKKTDVQELKNGLKTTSGIKPVSEDNGAARKLHPQPNLKTSEDVSRCISTPELSPDENSMWSAGERSVKKRKTAPRRRLNEFDHKASVARLRGSKNAKIVWGATGPVEVDQFKGEMCIYPKKADDSMPCSETLNEVIYEPEKKGRREIVSDFRQQKSMFVQVNKSDKRIVIDTVTGASSPMKTYSSKFTSAVNVEEATSDLITGNLKMIRKKYSKESVLSEGDTHGGRTQLPALPLAQKEQNQITVGNSQLLPNEGAAAPRPESLSNEKKGKTPEEVKIDGEVKTGANEKVAQKPQHMDNGTQISRSQLSRSIQTEIAKQNQFDKGCNPHESLTYIVYKQMKQNKTMGLINCITSDKLREIINKSEFTNKPWLTNSIEIPPDTKSVKNTERDKTVQKESSHSDRYTQHDENNWKDLDSRSNESFNRRILSDIEESQEDSLWSSEKQDELNGTQSIFLESLSSDTKASVTFDTLFNVSEYSLKETFKNCRDYFLEWYRGDVSSSGRMHSQAIDCTTANDVSTRSRSSTIRSVDPVTYSLTSRDTVSWCKTVPSTDDTETPEDGYHKGFKDLHAATYGAKKLALGMLEAKPPPGKPKILQERNETTKSEKGFKPDLDETNEKPIRTFQFLKDTVLFEKYKGSESTDVANFNSPEQRDGGMGRFDPSQLEHETCAINKTLGTKRGRFSPLSIFGSQLPRRIIPKDNLRQAGYSGYSEQKTRVLKAEYRETGDSTSTRNIKPSICTCENKSLYKPFNSKHRQEDESLGTSTIEVFNCLINSADRLNTIYANSSHKHMSVGAIRHKLNNCKYQPYVIPKIQGGKRASDNSKSKSLTQEKDHSKQSSFSGNSAMKFQRKQSTTLGSQRYSLSSTFDSRSSKRCNVVLQKYGEIPLARRLNLVPKGTTLASNVRLLHQRPLMPHNTINAMPQTKISKGPNIVFSPMEGANEQSRKTKLLQSRKRTCPSPRELRLKEENGEFKRRVADSGKAFVLKGDRVHTNLGNKTSFVAEMVSENLTITKNICMIESLRTESFGEDTKSDSREKKEETEPVSTPIPTQIEQKKVSKEISTPTRSVTLPPQANRHNKFDTFMKPHETFTPLTLPVKNEAPQALSKMTFCGPEQLMNIPACPLRSVNYILKDETKDQPFPEITHKSIASPVPRKRSETDSLIYLPQNCSNAKNDELSTIWSPTVNISPLYSPARMKTNYAPLPESKASDDNVLSKVESEHNSDVSTHLQRAQPNITFSTTPTKSKRLLSDARNISRIPRYAPVQKYLKKSPNMPIEPPKSPKQFLKMNRDEKSPLDLHKKEELKRQQQANKTHMLLSSRRQRLRLTKKANDQMVSNPSQKSPFMNLESPNQANKFQKISVENTEKGIKSVLPLLMNHTQDSIIIITPEKKVKHLNVIVNKRRGLPINSNMLIQDSPDFGTNKIQFRGTVPESYEDVIVDTGPETDNSQNTNKAIELLHEMLHKTVLNESGEKLEDIPYKGRDNQDKSGRSPGEIEKSFKISDLKIRMVRGAKTKENEPHHFEGKNIAPPHHQQTIEEGDQLFSRRKMTSRFDATEKEQEKTILTAKESVIQNARKRNVANKLSPTFRKNKELFNKSKIETPTSLITPELKAVNSSIKVTKIDTASDHRRSQPEARKSRIPRSTKKNALMPVKNIGEKTKVSNPRGDDQLNCESPIKVLTGEDYRIASLSSDIPEEEPSKKRSQVENIANSEAANKGHLLPTTIERAVENADRKRIPVLKMTPVAKRNRAENTPEEANEMTNSGKHNSIAKKKSQKRERILENKFTIKLDIAKPTACYPVCGNNETQSLNDTFSENIDLDKILDITKTEENYIEGYPGNVPGTIPVMTKFTKVSKDQSLFKSAIDKCGQKRQLKTAPTKAKTESPRKPNTNKKFKPKVDNFQQNPRDDRTKTEIKTNKALEARGNKCSIDKKTDSLMKGMAPYEIQPIKLSRETTPNEGKRTSLRRKKSTHGSHESFTATPSAKKAHRDVAKKALHSQKSQYQRNVSLSSVRLRETPGRVLELNMGSVEQEVNPENEQQFPRKSEKIIDSQKVMFFSDQSPTKRVKKSRLHVQTKSSSRMKEPVTSVLKSFEKSTEKHFNRGGNEGVVKPNLGKGKLSRANVAADHVKVPNILSDMDCSTTMPTTEAEMRIGYQLEKVPPLHKKRSLLGTVTARSGAEDTRESHDDILKSDQVQGMLGNLRAEERDVLIERLKDWIENRLSQTKNESDTSTEAIMGNELEHIFQVIIGSLDTKTLKSVYSKIQPKLEHLDQIVEVDEKSAENSETQNAENVQKECGPRLQSNIVNETENNRQSSTWNKNDRKIATKSRFQNFKIEQSPFFSRLPARDSGIVSRVKPEVNGNLFQALVDMQRRKFVSHGHSPNSHPVRCGPDFVETNFRAKLDVRARKLSDANFRSENGSDNMGSYNQHLKRPSSTKGILRNAFSSDLASNQQVRELKCKRSNNRFSEDNYKHARFPSVSSISCYDLGATYVASSKSPVPIQTASYVIKKKKGAQDESLRSLPRDLILGSSGQSERWTPFSRGRLSDYMQELDIKDSYRALGSREPSEYDESLFRCIASNSSAEVILSWLTRTPEIELSADRAMKRESSLKNIGLESTNISSTMPLPLPTDDYFLTGEKSSPWPENLEQKSISPLNLTDLDSNLQVMTSSETKDCHNGKIVDSVKTGSTAKSIHALLVRDDHDSSDKAPGEGKENDSKRPKEQRVSRAESLKNYNREMENVNASETRVLKGGIEVNRKEQNESFNNRIGRTKISRLRYVNQKRQIFNDGRQLAFIMPDSNATRFARQDVLSTKESNYHYSLLENEEQYVKADIPDFRDPSTECKQTYVHSSQTQVRKGCTKEEAIVKWAVQQENDNQKDSNPNCLEVMYSWSRSQSGDSGAQNERSTLSLEEHLNTRTPPTDSGSPGKVASKKWAKSEASTLSQVSFDWYKPSTVNPGQSSTATEQDLQMARRQDNEIENSESQLQETKEKSDSDFDAFELSDGREVSKCNSLTQNAPNDVFDTESNKPSQLRDQQQQVSDCLKMAYNERGCGEDKLRSMREDHVCEKKDELGVGLGRYTERKQMKQDMDTLFINGCSKDAIREYNTTAGQHGYQDGGSHQLAQTRQFRNVSGEISTSSWNRTFDVASAPRQKTEGQASHSNVGPDRSMFTGDKSSMRSVISRYEHSDVERHVSFASAREKNRKCSLSFSSDRSHCEEMKSENVSRSGYRYKTMNTVTHGASTLGSAILKRTHSHLRSFNDNYAEPMRNVHESLSSYTRPFVTTAHFSSDRMPFDLCKSDGAEPVAETRPSHSRDAGRKYSMGGFSYLFSENTDKGAGVDGCNGGAEGAPRQDVVRTRRPKMNTMVGQIVKMFERRLQFRPVQN